MNEPAASPDMTCQQFADMRHAEAARRNAFDEAVSLIRVLVAYGHQPLPADLVMQAGDWLAAHAPLDCPI